MPTPRPCIERRSNAMPAAGWPTTISRGRSSRGEQSMTRCPSSGEPSRSSRTSRSAQQPRHRAHGSGPPGRGHCPLPQVSRAQAWYAEAHNNLAVALAGQGNIDQAIAHYQRSARGRRRRCECALQARARPHHAATARRCRQSPSDGAGRPARARRGQQPRHRPRQPRANRCGPSALAQGRSLRPAYAEAHNNLGIVLSRGRHVDEAISHFRKALQLRPEDTEVRTNLFTALASRRRVGDSPLQWTPPR